MATAFQLVEWPVNGGLNDNENPLSLKAGDLIQADNVQYRGETAGTRPGVERADDYDLTIGGNPSITGIFDFRTDFDSGRLLVVIAGAAVHTDDVTTVALGGVTITPGANNYWTFAEHSESMYAAGGGPLDDFWAMDTTPTITAIPILDLSANALSPKYVFQKWNRVFTCAFTDMVTGLSATDTSSNPMVVRFSSLNQPTAWPTANTVGGISSVGGLGAHGGEFLTGFGEFVDNNGDWLLLLSNKRIYQAVQSGNSLAPFAISPGVGSIANGCVNQRAFASLGLDSSDAVYVSEDGIHSIRQSQEFGPRQDKFLSWKIRRFFQEEVNQERLSQAVAAYDATEGRVLIALPTGTSTENDTILMLDVAGTPELTAENAKWAKWTIGGGSNGARAANVLAPGRASDTGFSRRSFVYLGNEVGDVGRFSREPSATYVDFGTQSYGVTLQTLHQNFEQIGSDKQLGDTHVMIQPGGNYTPILRPIFDFGRRVGEAHQISMVVPPVALWGSGIWGTSGWAIGNLLFRDKLGTFGRGESFSFRISHNGTNEPFFIAGIGFQLGRSGEAGEAE